MGIIGRLKGILSGTPEIMDLRTSLLLKPEEAEEGCRKKIAIRLNEWTGPDSREEVKRTLLLDVPKGVKEGTTLCIPGHGEASTWGSQPGDVLVDIQVVH
jgi:hypothetical protein